MSENTLQTNVKDAKNVVVNNDQTVEKEKKIIRVQPDSDIAETKQAYAVMMDMPGLDPKDIRVNLDKEILTVEAVSEVEGLAPVKFYRQFRVMRGLDASKCQAEYKKGILTLRLPKPETAQPHQIKIQAE